MEQTVGIPTAPTGNVGRDLSNKSGRNPSLFGKVGDIWHVWEMDLAWERLGELEFRVGSKLGVAKANIQL